MAHLRVNAARFQAPDGIIGLIRSRIGPPFKRLWLPECATCAVPLGGADGGSQLTLVVADDLHGPGFFYRHARVVQRQPGQAPCVDCLGASVAGVNLGRDETQTTVELSGRICSE